VRSTRAGSRIRSAADGARMTLSDFTRWLYRGQRPDWMARILNRAVAAVGSSGVAPNDLVTLEVAGRAAVIRSGGREEVQLHEVSADQRAPILKAYLQRAPGARPHVPVSKDAALAEFQKIAAAFPVFRVVSFGRKG
jgi:hypothetical protein